MTFGCFHTVYENKRATEFILQEFRKYYPDAPYTLICDGGVDYSDLAAKYNCKYIHSNYFNTCNICRYFYYNIFNINCCYVTIIYVN